MDVPQYLIKSFLGNRHFNPYETTLLVGELESMGNVVDRQKFISDVITADSEFVAFFLRLEAQMMAPVEYMPAATINRAPMVNTPELENPFKLSCKGASLKVMVMVRAPTKIATGEILVSRSRLKVIARIAMVIMISIDIRIFFTCGFHSPFALYIKNNVIELPPIIKHTTLD